MLSLIPYFPPLSFELMGIPIDSWSLLVCFAFIFGMEFARSRAVALKLSIKDVVDGCLFIVGMGFVVGHLVHVLAYNPHLIDEEGWVVLLKVWAGFSSNGGFLGAIIGTISWIKWIRPHKPFWLYADTFAYSLPFGWFWGRVGCFTAHDHVGQLSNFLLAVDFGNSPYGAYYGGARHDLGLYEAIFVFFIALVFFSVRKKELYQSSFAILFCLLYAPVRFGLDFLRHSDLPNPDTRWAGLTPAQYGSIALFTAGLILLSQLKHRQRYVYPSKQSSATSDSAAPLPSDGGSGA